MHLQSLLSPHQLRIIAQSHLLRFLRVSLPLHCLLLSNPHHTDSVDGCLARANHAPSCIDHPSRICTVHNRRNASCHIPSLIIVCLYLLKAVVSHLMMIRVLDQASSVLITGPSPQDNPNWIAPLQTEKDLRPRAHCVLTLRLASRLGDPLARTGLQATLRQGASRSPRV